MPIPQNLLLHLILIPKQKFSVPFNQNQAKFTTNCLCFNSPHPFQANAMTTALMNAETVARTINLIIAPTVLLSVCTLIQNGILGRYTSVGDRMRKIDQERLQLLHDKSLPHWDERMALLDKQVPVFIRRHTLLQSSALTIYLAMLILMTCMFAIAISVIWTSNGWAIAALFLFLTGGAVLLIGVSLIAMEVRISHLAICYELRRLSTWGKF
jgi:hypothetical protein